MKTTTITLSYPHLNRDRNYQPSEGAADNQVYRVERITDSTEYDPGQQLLRKQVDKLCSSRDWKVTIVPSASA